MFMDGQKRIFTSTFKNQLKQNIRAENASITLKWETYGLDPSYCL